MFYYTINNDEATIFGENGSERFPLPILDSNTNMIIPSTIMHDGNRTTVKHIGNHAFYNWSEINSVIIPNTIESIGDFAFSGCTGLRFLTIPRSVNSISNNSFDQSPVDTIVFLANASLTNTMFRHVKKVSIGGYARNIASNAFQNCTTLVYLELGDSVQSIGANAFSGCSALSEITSNSRVAPTLGTSVFDGVSSTIPVNIPCGSEMSYYSRWNYFSNFIAGLGHNFSATTADAEMGSVDVLTSPTCTAPTAVVSATANAGFVFDRWSDNNTNNPRSITVTSDTVIVAYFASLSPRTDTVIVHDTIVVNNYIHDTTLVTLYIHDSTIVTNYVVVYDTITLDAPGYDSVQRTMHQITVTSNNDMLGVGVGSGSFLGEATYQIVALPADGYFLRWRDGSTDNPRTVTVNSDTTFVALFDTILSGDCSIATLPYAENFDTYTTSTSAKTGVKPACWTLAHKDVSMATAYQPQIYYGLANAHSGRYSLFMNYRGIYAMPLIDCDIDIHTLQLSMYVRQPNANYQLQVGVMNDLDDETSFVPVATISNGTTTMTKNTIDFRNYAGNGRYIAFRNVLGSGSGSVCENYIDDIVLDRIEEYEVSVAAIPENAGDVSGGGVYEPGAEVTLSATPRTGYYFSHWSDGENNYYDNPLTIEVDGNSNYYAVFGTRVADTIYIHDTVEYCQTFDVVVVSNNTNLGECAGSGVFNRGTRLEILAIPRRGSRFLRWSDGNTDNPRIVVITENTNLTAIFEAVSN